MKDHSRDSFSWKDSFTLRLSRYSFVSYLSQRNLQGNTIYQIIKSKTCEVSFGELFRHQINFGLPVSMRRKIGKSKASFLEISLGAPGPRGLTLSEEHRFTVQF